jgi:hypothetical protein
VEDERVGGKKTSVVRKRATTLAQSCIPEKYLFRHQ